MCMAVYHICHWNLYCFWAARLLLFDRYFKNNEGGVIKEPEGRPTLRNACYNFGFHLRHDGFPGTFSLKVFGCWAHPERWPLPLVGLARLALKLRGERGTYLVLRRASIALLRPNLQRYNYASAYLGVGSSRAQ